MWQVEQAQTPPHAPGLRVSGGELGRAEGGMGRDGEG